MTSLLDASALLAFVQGEAGRTRSSALDADAHCSTVSWSEVAQKSLSPTCQSATRVRAAGADWHVAAALLSSYGLRLEPATTEDGERAARLWRSGAGLSLADRFCLALGERLSATVWTADTA